MLRQTFLAVTLITTSAFAQQADPFAEGVRTTEPLEPAEQRAKFKLPPGFEIQLVAAEPDLRKPMNMAFDATGRLWVSESREYPFPAKEGAELRDSIRIFSDFGPDGKARKMEVFADKLNIPIGLYPFRTVDGHWKCVAWSIPNIWLFEDTDGDGKADKREVLFGPLGWERDTHGNQASFRRGDDGWIYATHGFNNHSTFKAKDGSTITLDSGNTYRFKIDGSRIEQYTWGQVNPYGLCWDDRGNLYSADCHSSPIYQLLKGGYYPSFGKPHDGLGFAPQTIQHSHGSTAICAPMMIRDTSWPADLQGHMLVGNVMTSRLNHDLIEWHGASSKGKELPDFLTSEDPWFRPVDLQWGPDGALYIADFYNRIIGHYEVPLQHPGRDRERGRIWRVVYKGEKATAAREVEGADNALVKTEEKLSFLRENGVRLAQSGVGKPNSLLGFAKPEEGLLQSEEGKPRPEEGLLQSEEGKLRPEEGLARSEEGKPRPEEGLAQSDEGKPRPEEGLLQSDEGKLRPDGGLVQSDEGKLRPDGGLVQSDEGKLRPDGGLVQSEKFLSRADEVAVGNGNGLARRDAKVVSDFSRLGATGTAADELRVTEVSAERSRALSSTVSPTKVVDYVRPSDESALHLIATSPEPALPMAVALATSLPKEEQIAALIKELGSANPTRRSLALNELCDRFSDGGVGFKLVEALGVEKGAQLHIGSTWALWRTTGAAEIDLGWSVKFDPSSQLRTHTLRVIGEVLAGVRLKEEEYFRARAKGLTDYPTGFERGTKRAGELLPNIQAALADVDPVVRRVAAETLGVYPNPITFAPLLKLLRTTDKADDHLIYSTRVALREHLRDAEVVKQLKLDGLSKEDLQAILDILPAVPGEHAALLRLDLFEKLDVSAAELAKHLPGIIKNAPADRLNGIAALARKKFPDDASALVSILTALEQRGAQPDAAVRDWAAAIVPKLLDGKQTTGWTANPAGVWAFQDRKSADGENARVMSSIPNGETLTGVLRSAPFEAPDKLRFYLCGHDGTPPGPAGKKNFVRLVDADGKVLREEFPPRNDVAQRIEWDLADVRGKRVMFEATDGDAGSAYAWLAFGRFKPELPELILVEPGSTSGKGAAADIARSLKLTQFTPLLAEVFADRKNDTDSRAAAARAVVALLGEKVGQVTQMPSFAATLASADEPDVLREKVAVVLGSVTSPSICKLVVDAMPTASSKLQQSFATALSANRCGTVVLISAIEAGKASPLVLRDKATADRLRANAKGEEAGALNALLAKLPPANVEADKLIATRRAGFKGGDIAKGATVFQTNCAVCHQIGKVGNLVGPQLDGVGGRGLDRIIEDILDPNRNVDRAFRLSIVTLKDGGVASGLLRREEGGQMVLADIQGKESSIPQSNVAKREEADTSLMPPAFGQTIPPADFNDLLAYLLSQRPTK